MQNLPALVATTSLALWAVFPAFPGSAETVLFDPETGLRTAHYRAPVPDPPPGIEAVDSQHVETLIQERAVLVDVRPLRIFEIEEDGQWIVPEPIESLPGAVWLPVVGWGEIEPWAEAYLDDSLDQIATAGETIVVYCRVDCWLSWNAAQRVAALGYETKWFPGGIEEWRDLGGRLESTMPWPVPK